MDALRQYAGTIIFVSHDRAFMEALSTKTLELSPGQPSPGPSPGGASLSRLFYGNYAYYLDRVAGEAAAGGASNPPVEEIAPPAPPGPFPGPDTPAGAGKNSGPNPVIPMKAGREGPLSAGAWREQEKRKQLLVRRLRRREEEILETLETLEGEKARLEGDLALPEVYRNGEKARTVRARLAALAGEIEAKTREWESAAGELGEL